MITETAEEVQATTAPLQGQATILTPDLLPAEAAEPLEALAEAREALLQVPEAEAAEDLPEVEEDKTQKRFKII